MNAITAPKSPSLNRLEGMTLTAYLQALPLYTVLGLVFKHFSSSQGAYLTTGTVVVTAALLHALIVPWLGPKFPKAFKNSYEPLFFDANLSFSEKILRWRTQPLASLQLLINTVALSVLGVQVLSVG
jgi:hypothetical protein